MQKPKPKKAAAKPSPAAAPLVDRMRQVLATVPVEGGAQMPALLVQHLQQQYRAAPKGSALRRRLLALRLAVLGGAPLHLVPVTGEAPPEPVIAAPAAPPPPPAPEPPKGVVNTVSLEDAAKLLFASLGGADDAPPAPGPLKVDFSMFGDDPEDTPPQAQPEADYDPFAALADLPEPKAAPQMVDFSMFDDDPEDTPPAAQAALAGMDFDPFAALAELPAPEKPA